VDGEGWSGSREGREILGRERGGITIIVCRSRGVSSSPALRREDCGKRQKQILHRGRGAGKKNRIPPRKVVRTVQAQKSLRVFLVRRKKLSWKQGKKCKQGSRINGERGIHNRKGGGRGVQDEGPVILIIALKNVRAMVKREQRKREGGAVSKRKNRLEEKADWLLSRNIAKTKQPKSARYPRRAPDLLLSWEVGRGVVERPWTPAGRGRMLSVIPEGKGGRMKGGRRT